MLCSFVGRRCGRFSTPPYLMYPIRICMCCVQIVFSPCRVASSFSTHALPIGACTYGGASGCSCVRRGMLLGVSFYDDYLAQPIVGARSVPALPDTPTIFSGEVSRQTNQPNVSSMRRLVSTLSSLLVYPQQPSFSAVLLHLGWSCRRILCLAGNYRPPHSYSRPNPKTYCFLAHFSVVPQVDSGKIFISAPSPTSSVESTAREGGVANTSEAFEFLSATFGATLPRGHVFVVPSLPEDACFPLAPLATVAAAETSDRGGDGGGGGGVGADARDTAVLVKRGGCSFGVKAKNVQVRGWCG